MTSSSAYPYALSALAEGQSRDMYFSLLHPSGFSKGRADSAGFLAAQLQQTRMASCDMPAQPSQLMPWLREHQQVVGRQFQAYLKARQAGEPRWYFGGKAHALYFLRALAPTNMIDGAWLYGVLRHWQDTRFADLVGTYLEELGQGAEAMNHAALYRTLLKTNACEDWPTLEDRFFTQGAVQLALAANTERYLPEVIGFNLGHEQLPLHVLITAHELRELNIDPYYFNLHTHTDNAQCGHAKAAVHAVTAAMPALGHTGKNMAQQYMARVQAGVRLNAAGVGTLNIIRHFDLLGEVIRIMQSKAGPGQYMHSQHCVIEGRSLNQWLADADHMARFVYVLQKHGWIQRHQDPQHSRFWQLIAGQKAPMAGVFTGYERQVIYDWIAGEALDSLPRVQRLGHAVRMQAMTEADATPSVSNVYDLRSGRRLPMQAATAYDVTEDALAMQRYLQGLGDQGMSFLLDWMSPAKHATPLGLCATRYFKACVDRCDHRGVPLFESHALGRSGLAQPT